MKPEIERRQGDYLARLTDQLQSEGIGECPSPPLLFHYTTTVGLLGIIESGKIWATHYRYVNDTSELEYANSLFMKSIDKKLLAGSGPTQTLLWSVARTPAMFAWLGSVFISCFCEEGDLLSQWRTYGARGHGGYAIGLSATPESLGRLNPRFSLHRVTYDQTQMERLIDFLLTSFCQDALDLCGSSLDGVSGPLVSVENEAGKFKLVPKTRLPSLSPLCVSLAEAISELQVCFKSPHFSSEKEWRLVCRPSEQFPFNLRMRPMGDMLVPYLELPLNLWRPTSTRQGQDWTFKWEKVICAPGLSSDQTELSLRYLANEIFPDVTIEHSKINVRV
jgi:hypothetical protein